MQRPPRSGRQPRPSGTGRGRPPHGEPPFRGPGVHAPPGIGPGAPDEVQQLGFPLVVGMVSGQQHIAFPEHLGEPVIPCLRAAASSPRPFVFARASNPSTTWASNRHPREAAAASTNCRSSLILREARGRHAERSLGTRRRRPHGAGPWNLHRRTRPQRQDAIRAGRAPKAGPAGHRSGGPISGHPQARSQIPWLPRHRGRLGRPGP